MRPATGDAFRNITVNNNTISADSVTDTLTLIAGTNVTLTADVENDSITINAGNPGAAGTGDFTFTNSAASVPVNATLTLTAFNNTTKESKLTLSPTTTSSLYAANNLELGIGYGTGSELYWTFDAVGTLTAPGRIVTPEIEGKLDSLAIFSNWAKDTGISIVSTNNLESVTLISDRLVGIVTNVGPSEKSWIFGADGSTQFPSYKFPSADGSVNQVLSTNGSGTLSWSTPYTSTYIGTTAISFNRASSAQTLTGITSIDGSAGSVAAANITGITLASGVTGSSLTSVGTLTNLLVGSTANFTDWPNAKLVASQANSGDTHSYNAGIVGEAVASASDTALWGVGVYGKGSTNSATRSAGIVGDGGVTNTNDGGSAIGVRGYSTETHAGGFNIGLYGEASGSGTGNYALAMQAGGILSVVAQTWSLVDNNTAALSFDAIGKTGILKVVTTDGYEGVTMSGTLAVTGALTKPNLTAFRVIGNGGQVSATTTLTSTNWTLDFQQGTALNTTTGIFTAPTAGLYTTHLVMRTHANNNSTINQAIIIKTSGGTDTNVAMLEFAINTTMNHAGVSSVVKLAVGDTLKVVVAVGTLSFDSNDNWSIAFLG